MAEEEIQQTPDEILNETLETNVDKVCHGDLAARISGLNVLIDELKKSTSSMTSVPKPMKHLVKYNADLIQAYNTFTNEEFRTKLADLLSLLTIVDVDETYDVLKYRLESPTENIGFWGHEYVRCLTRVIMRAYKNPQDVPEGTDINPLVNQIAHYYMEHNDEPDACDLLLELDRLGDIVELVDEDSHNRVCTCLLQLYDYKPDPINVMILKVIYDIYMKLGKVNQALVIAIKMSDKDLALEIFRNCEDPLVKTQLAFILARQLIVFDDEMDQELIDIATNVDMYTRYNDIAERLGRNKPKTPDDVLQFQATIGNRGAQRDDKNNLMMAKSFVSAFHNAAIKKDLYFTAPNSDELINRNKEMGRAVAVAALGMLNLWDIENGLNSISRYTSEENKDPYVIMGGLTGVGIISAAVRSEYDAALAILSDPLLSDNENIQIGAIFGLAMAYAGSARTDILELLTQKIDINHFRVCAYATLAIGLVFIGNPSDEALTAVSQTIFSLGEACYEPDNLPFFPFLALGIGLIYLGLQSKCEAALELVAAIEVPKISDFFQVAVESCAYAGTGNVLQIQKLLIRCSGENDLSHAAAVIGIAIIALGEPLGCQMSKRMFEHVLQYGKPYARRMVPIAIALTSISQPLPELVDTLHRIGHDTDLAVVRNAAIALGLLGAGTNNTRVINTLRALEQFHKGESSVLTLLRISEGLTHLGQGLMTLSPTYGDSLLIHPVALGSLLTIAYASISAEDIFIKKDPLLMYFITPAIGPRFLVTLDEELKILPLQVRVGQAVDVVGQAGKPRTISGFQTLDTPVILEAGKRAEFVDDTYEPLSPILEGFVIVRKRETKPAEEK